MQDKNTLFIRKEEFEKYIIAQDDDNDYQESGYLVLELPAGMAAIISYSHCSCYGTWDSLASEGFDAGDIPYDWYGSIKELVRMAFCKADPAMPERPANSEDYNYDHLFNVYEQVLKHYPLEAMMFGSQDTPT